MLAVTASAIGATRVLQLKEGWQEPAILWAVTVADSGQLKSPALDQSLLCLAEIEDALYQQFEQEHGRAGDDDTDPPAPRRVLMGDITIEQVAVLLQKNPRGLLLGAMNWPPGSTLSSATGAVAATCTAGSKSTAAGASKWTGRRRSLPTSASAAPWCRSPGPFSLAPCNGH